MPILQEQEPLALATRLKNNIANSIDRRPVWDGMHLAIKKYKEDYPDACHRPVGPSIMYNCHGLTFAARRSNISDSQQVRDILRDDGYKEVVSNANVLAGDIVIYEHEGDISHSGIVVQVDPASGGGLFPVIYVLSKWGHAHEVIHEVRYSPYKDIRPKFFRLHQ
jgi:hypothetical protein